MEFRVWGCFGVLVQGLEFSERLVREGRILVAARIRRVGIQVEGLGV